MSKNHYPMTKCGWIACLVALSLSARSQTRVEVDAAAEGPEVNPHMYGIFFEELGHSGDGGLYAELVRNRSFEDCNVPEGMTFSNGFAVARCRDKIPWPPKEPVPGWIVVKKAAGAAAMQLDKSVPLNAAQQTSLRLEIQSAGGGVANTGYWGMSFKEDAAYHLNFFARCDFKGVMTAVLEDRDGNAVSPEVTLAGPGREWKRLSATLTARSTTYDGRLALYAGAPGTVWIDVVSLFPADTFNGRSNGLRPDLAQMLKDLRPGFLRFPGGCVTEGLTLEQGHAWKKTIGDIAERPGVWNAMWGYRRTDGIGMLELLQLAEDIGAVSLFCNNMGIACTIHTAGGVPCRADQLPSYVADTVDAISYAVDPATTPWGALRAKHGHPAPFALPYVNIGNELNSREYTERYPAFYQAVKAKYPGITAIAYAPVGRPKAVVEIKDVHDYRDEKWFLENLRRFDSADRHGPKVSNMELACRGPLNHTLRAALLESAYMLGLERNADVVRLVSYAPLLSNVRHEGAWKPVLIYFDNHRAYGTPSYYAQMLFMHHRPDVVLSTKVGGTAGDGLVALAGRDRKTGEIVVKIVNLTDEDRPVELAIRNAGALQDSATEWLLTSADPKAQNSFEQPRNVVPVERQIRTGGTALARTVPRQSFTVLRMRTR